MMCKNRHVPCCTQGIAAAKANNVKFGRPKIERPADWDRVVLDWKEGNITAKQAMSELGLKKATFYSMLKTFQIK